MLLLALSVLSAASLGCARAACPVFNPPAVTEQLVYYDAHDGTVLSDQEVTTFEEAGIAFYCANQFPDCDPTEGRRLDGSCNSLKAPAAGAGHAPFKRIRSSVFSEDGSGYAPRKSANGSMLPNPRRLRTKMLAMGEVAGRTFTQLMLYFFVTASSDLTAMDVQDTLSYLKRPIPCCSAQGVKDPVCANIEVPVDDPVHRFDGLRCLNMTWPHSFQSYGCLSNSTKPERINYGTPFFDLSLMYGNDAVTSPRQRTFSGGQLLSELTSSGRQWPSFNTSLPTSTNALDGIIGLQGVNFMFGLFYWREHNRLAAALAEINPCWDDEKLFTTAREINIAAYQQTLYYELLGSLMGTDNLIASGVLSDNDSFRDVYDENVRPEVTLEALTSLRWVHTFQEGMFQMYNEDGEKVRDVVLTLLVQNLDLLKGEEYNLKYFMQGSFRQPTAAIDNGIYDPYMAESGLGRQFQYALDVATSDVAKSRLLGLAPYIDYVEYCTGKAISSFDDLAAAGLFTDQHLYMLKELYESPSDIDLIVGLWAEELVDGGFVPQTYYCLVTEQLVRSVVSDRHWFERDSRPNAFTAAQLAEIRKASVARLMCDHADSVVEIQPKPLEIISSDNALTSCDQIPSMDLSAWADDASASDERRLQVIT